MAKSFLFEGDLGALHIDCVRSFRRISDFEGDFVAFMKFAKLNSNQRIAVKKQTFCFSFSGDEAKAVEQFFNFTCHIGRDFLVWRISSSLAPVLPRNTAKYCSVRSSLAPRTASKPKVQIRL